MSGVRAFFPHCFLLCFVVRIQPGSLKHTQAIGWYLEEANMAQVSVNITNHEETPIHVVYEEIVKEAKVSTARQHDLASHMRWLWKLRCMTCSYIGGASFTGVAAGSVRFTSRGCHATQSHHAGCWLLHGARESLYTGRRSKDSFGK